MKKLNPLIMDQNQVRTIASNLQTLMAEHGVSELEIARSLNTSVMTVRRVISGETADPRISTLKLIADYFNVTIDSLMSESYEAVVNKSKSSPTFVPILTWQLVESAKLANLDLKKWEEWYPMVGDQDIINDQTFALESKPSMQPRYPINTLFFINPLEKPQDGDIVLVKFVQDNNLSLREIIIDPPKWQLNPIVFGSESLYYDSKYHEILGVVVLSLLRNRK